MITTVAEVIKTITKHFMSLVLIDNKTTSRKKANSAKPKANAVIEFRAAPTNSGNGKGGAKKNKARNARKRKARKAKGKGGKMGPHPGMVGAGTSAGPSDPMEACMLACRLSPETYLDTCAKYGMDPLHCLPKELRDGGYEVKLYKSHATLTGSAGDTFAFVSINNAAYSADSLRSEVVALQPGTGLSVSGYAQDPKFIKDTPLYQSDVIIGRKVVVGNSQNQMTASGDIIVSEVQNPLQNTTNCFDDVGTIAGLKSAPGSKSCSVKGAAAYIFTPRMVGGQMFTANTGAASSATPVTVTENAYPIVQSARQLSTDTNPISNNTQIGFRENSTAGTPLGVYQREIRPIGIIALYGVTLTAGSTTYGSLDDFILMARKRKVPSNNNNQINPTAVVHSSTSSLLTSTAAVAENLVAKAVGSGVIDTGINLAEDAASLIPLPGAGLIADAVGGGIKMLEHKVPAWWGWGGGKN